MNAVQSTKRPTTNEVRMSTQKKHKSQEVGSRTSYYLQEESRDGDSVIWQYVASKLKTITHQQMK